MQDWDPEQYLHFKRERTQPSIDLVARINIDDPKTIIDIGCGPGNSTQVLLNRWPNAVIVGLDNSEKMIERARKDYPNQKWIVGDASKFEINQAYDITFSNAAIHWIQNHDVLIPRLFQLVKKNGVLAVQVPVNHESPLYKMIERTSHNRKWSALTAGYEQVITYHDAEYYYNTLVSLTQTITIWETTYYHILNSHQELIEWYRSTAMKPILERLQTEKNRAEFEAEILSESKKYYPMQRDGRIIYPFKRLFFTAFKSENS
jgi:trans-aconitate 2-methyltransferase